MKVIDVHSHIVPEGFPAMPATCSCGDRWPHMAHHGEGKAAVMIGGKEFRRIDSRGWDTQRRLADMDSEDVLMQVLSPMPELLSYWLEPEATLAMSRHINAAIGAMIATAPKRFAGLGMVPLQDPQLAARELTTLKDEHGLLGVEIGSNMLGRAPGDPFFDDFYAEAERLGLCIFVHALHPVGTERIVGPAPLAAFINFPTDTGLAAASCITGRTLEKFPKLRIAFSHGGGTLASILPRLHHGWTVAPELTVAFDSPRETARRFWYDNIVFDTPTLRHMVDVFGITQVFAGSDYPFLAGQRFPGRPYAELKFPSHQQDQLLAGNALHFLGLVGGTRNT